MASNAAEGTSMEQVRELLMGTQLKDLENRILRQEERFLQEIADLRDTLKNRTESLENFMKSESSSLMHRLKEEKTERTAAIKSEQRERTENIKAGQKEHAEAMKQEKREREEALAKMAKELAKNSEAFDRKLDALTATLDTVEKELRELLLSESSRLSGATEERYKDALAALARTASQLQNDHVARSSLSAMFTDFAVKLAGDVSLSGERSDAGDGDANGGANSAE